MMVWLVPFQSPIDKYQIFFIHDVLLNGIWKFTHPKARKNWESQSIDVPFSTEFNEPCLYAAVAAYLEPNNNAKFEIWEFKMLPSSSQNKNLFPSWNLVVVQL